MPGETRRATTSGSHYAPLDLALRYEDLAVRTISIPGDDSLRVFFYGGRVQSHGHKFVFITLAKN